MLNIKSLSFKYNNDKYQDIFLDSDFVLDKNCFAAICGPSGTGKTTLLNIISGIIELEEGKIEVDKSQIHYVNVDNNVIGILSVIDNLRLCCSNDKLNKDVLNKLGLLSLRKKKCSLLSKGERERVALAMALVDDKKIVLIDEPTANLDVNTSKMVFEILANEGKKRLVLIATHDLQLAKSYCDIVFTIKEGKIVEDSNEIKNSATGDLISHEHKNSNIFVYLKLAFKNLMQNSVYFIINCLIVFISLAFLFFSVSSVNQNSHETMIRTIKNINTNYLDVKDSNFCKYKYIISDYIKNEGFDNGDIIPYINAKISDDLEMNFTFEKYYNNEFIQERISTFKQRIDEKYQFFDCYPVYLSQDAIDYLKSKEYYSTLEVGTMLYYNSISGFNSNIRFIIDGILNEKMAGEDSYFPLVVPYEAYYKSLTTIVMNDYYYLDFLNEYNNYINTLDLDSREREKYKEVSEFADAIIDADLIDRESIRKGVFPDNPGEVLVDPSIYWALFEENTYLTELSSKYRDKIKFEFSNNEGTFFKNGDEFKVVGEISKKPSGLTNDLYYKYIALNHTDFIRIKEKVNENEILNSSDILISKQRVIKIFNDDTERLDLSSIIPYTEADIESNFNQTGKTMVIFSIIIMVLGLGLILIYININMKKNIRNFSLLTLIGKRKRDLVLLHVLMMSVIFIVPLVFALALSMPLYSLFLSLMYNNISFAINYLLPYLSLLIASLVLVLLFIPTIFMMKRKKIMEGLNNE